jgi:thiamine biosynthesis lipoprotein
MRETRVIMGMPISVEVIGSEASEEQLTNVLQQVFDYFVAVDERFSTYKPHSEIMRINRGELNESEYSDDMKEILALAEKTKKDTNGYFSVIRPDGSLDPSGIVKGWAINKAATVVKRLGYKNYFLDIGGDIQSSGTDEQGKKWTIGIRNPFNQAEIVKVVCPQGQGVATSGTYIRGQHIYNPHQPSQAINDIVSLTVVGPDVYEADRFATAAFAMGKEGVMFIEQLPNFEGYCIDAQGVATMTTGFDRHVPQ